MPSFLRTTIKQADTTQPLREFCFLKESSYFFVYLAVPVLKQNEITKKITTFHFPLVALPYL